MMQDGKSKTRGSKTRGRHTMSGTGEIDSLAEFSALATFQRCLPMTHCLLLDTYKFCSLARQELVHMIIFKYFNKMAHLDRARFESAYSTLIQDMLEHAKGYSTPDEGIEWLRKVCFVPSYSTFESNPRRIWNTMSSAENASVAWLSSTPTLTS